MVLKIFNKNKNLAYITLKEGNLNYAEFHDGIITKNINIPLPQECIFNNEILKPDLLNDAFKSLGGNSHVPVKVIIPSRNVIIKNLNYPDVLTLNEVYEALEFELEDYFYELKRFLPFKDNKLNAENTVYDVVISQDNKFTAAAVSAYLVNEILNFAERSGMSVNAITPDISPEDVNNVKDMKFDLRTKKYIEIYNRRNSLTPLKILAVISLSLFLIFNIFYICSSLFNIKNLNDLIEIETGDFKDNIEEQRALTAEVKNLRSRIAEFENIFEIIKNQPPVLETLKFLELHMNNKILINSIKFEDYYQVTINAAAAHEDDIINLVDDLNSGAELFNIKKVSVPFINNKNNKNNWKEFRITLIY